MIDLSGARKAALEVGWGHDTATLNRVLDAFLSALSREGMVVVPIEPTADMAAAGQYAIQSPARFNGVPVITAQQVYAAMIAASSGHKGE